MHQEMQVTELHTLSRANGRPSSMSGCGFSKYSGRVLMSLPSGAGYAPPVGIVAIDSCFDEAAARNRPRHRIGRRFVCSTGARHLYQAGGALPVPGDGLRQALGIAQHQI